MNISSQVDEFRSAQEARLHADTDLPNEYREPLNVTRFVFSLRRNAVTDKSKSADFNDAAFLVEKLHEKLPDAHLETLARLADPLLPELREWLTVQKKELLNIGVRTEFDKNLAVIARLCNHAGGSCDCENHPVKPGK